MIVTNFGQDTEAKFTIEKNCLRSNYFFNNSYLNFWDLVFPPGKRYNFYSTEYIAQKYLQLAQSEYFSRFYKSLKRIPQL